MNVRESESERLRVRESERERERELDTFFILAFDLKKINACVLFISAQQLVLNLVQQVCGLIRPEIKKTGKKNLIVPNSSILYLY